MVGSFHGNAPFLGGFFSGEKNEKVENCFMFYYNENTHPNTITCHVTSTARFVTQYEAYFPRGYV